MCVCMLIEKVDKDGVVLKTTIIIIIMKAKIYQNRLKMCSSTYTKYNDDECNE